MVIMKKILYLLTILLVFSCKEKELEPVNSSGEIPGEVTVKSIENMPAASKINFSVPFNKDLLYTKVSYTKDGIVYEKKVSLYSTSVTLEGFAESREYPVTLQTFNRAGQSGASITTTIYPEESPIYGVLETMEIKEVNGGLDFKWANPLEYPVIVTLLHTAPGIPKDTTSLFLERTWIQSELDTGVYQMRDLDAVPYDLGVTVSDYFGNKTDTLMASYTPKFEQEYDLSTFNFLAPDYPDEDVPGNPNFDNLGSAYNGSFTDKFRYTIGSSAFPPFGYYPTYVIDMLEPRELTRMIIWPHTAFGSGSSCHFVLYGRNERFKNNTPFDETEWEFIGEFLMLPSEGGGAQISYVEEQPYSIERREELYSLYNELKGSSTAKDELKQGMLLPMPEGIPSYQYLGVKMKSNFINDKMNYFDVAEIKIFGK
jgi:hypothetical protein